MLERLSIWFRGLIVAVLAVGLIALLLHLGEWAAAHLDMAVAASVLAWLGEFLHKHQEIAVLFTMAAIATMPEDLPAPLNRVPLFAWLWTWWRRMVQLFASMSHPQLTSSHAETVTDHGRVVEDKLSAPVPQTVPVQVSAPPVPEGKA